MKLSEILTDEQINRVMEIMDEPDYTRRIIALKAYLGRFRSELEAKDILPEYLAYVIESIRLTPQIIHKPCNQN